MIQKTQSFFKSVKGKIVLWVAGGLISILPFLIPILAVVIIATLFAGQGTGLILSVNSSMKNNENGTYYTYYEPLLNKYLTYSEEDNEGQGYVTISRTWLTYTILMDTYCSDNVSTNWVEDDNTYNDGDYLIKACAWFYYYTEGYNYSEVGVPDTINTNTCVIDTADYTEDLISSSDGSSSDYYDNNIINSNDKYSLDLSSSLSTNKYDVTLIYNPLYENFNITPRNSDTDCVTGYERFTTPTDGTPYVVVRWGKNLSVKEKIEKLDEAYFQLLVSNDEKNSVKIAEELWELAYTININEQHFQMSFDDMCSNLTSWYNNMSSEDDLGWDHYNVSNICSAEYLEHVDDLINAQQEADDVPFYFLVYPLASKIGSADTSSTKITSAYYHYRKVYKDGKVISEGEHGGTDIGTGAGIEIYAACDGTVTEVWKDEKTLPSGGQGNYIVITCDTEYLQEYSEYTSCDEDSGECNTNYSVADGDIVFEVEYMHMLHPSELNVGDTVSVGDLVGYVGSTGNSTGNHLHFQLNYYYVDSSGNKTSTTTYKTDALYYVDWYCYFDGICLIGEDNGNVVVENTDTNYDSNDNVVTDWVEDEDDNSSSDNQSTEDLDDTNEDNFDDNNSNENQNTSEEKDSSENENSSDTNNENSNGSSNEQNTDTTNNIDNSNNVSNNTNINSSDANSSFGEQSSENSDEIENNETSSESNNKLSGSSESKNEETESSSNDEENNQEDEKETSSSMLEFIILVLILTAIAAFSLWYYFKKKKQEEF